MKNINYYNNSVVDGYYDIIFRRKKVFNVLGIT